MPCSIHYFKKWKPWLFWDKRNVQRRSTKHRCAGSRDYIVETFIVCQTFWLPSTLASAIKECDKTRFPNLFILLKIGCTLPVTSCECERSFSTMRRLRTWLQSSMNMKRLSALAIMNIHRDIEVNYQKAAQLFFQLHPQKLQESNLVVNIWYLSFDCIFAVLYILFRFSV